MRIVCQKCSAAYAIDDKFVTPKGVRAQCPRCRHMQLVKKDDAPPPEAAPPAAPGGPSPFLFDLGAKPPAAGGSELHFGTTSPAPGGQSGGGLGLGLAPPYPGGAQGAPAAAPEAPSPFDFGGPPPPGPGGGEPSPFDFGGPPAPAAPSGGSPFDFGGPPPGPAPAAGGSPFDFSAPTSPGGPSAFDFGAPPAAPPPAPVAPPRSSPVRLAAPGAKAPAPAASADFDAVLSAPSPSQVSGARCRTCGKEITDPFDQALGVCDDCRNKAAAPPSPEPVATKAPPPRASPGAAPVFPAATTAIGQHEHARLRTATRQDEGGGKGKLIGIVVGAVVVLAIAIGLVVKRPWAVKPPPLVVKGGSGGTKPVEGIIQQWRLKYPELEDRTAAQLIDEGEELLAKDTTKSYLDAEEAFQQALVLDPSNGRALAGWVLSVAFGRAGQIDEATAKAAESMLSASEQRGNELRVFVAHAHFLIARGGNPNDIRVLADRGLLSTRPNDKALALLAVGQTQLTKNPQQADDSFTQALATDAKLKRAYFFQAQLAVMQGRFKDATAALEKRLQLDADQWEAAEELARLSLDVSEPGRAKKVLEAAKAAAPRSGRPRLGMAMMAYQHQGDFAGATEQLNALISDAEITRAERADALVHLATLQRIQGNAEAATESIDKALELTPDSVPARLQKFLVLLDKGVSSSARLELDALKGRLGDKYLEATLEGRLLIAENRLPDALQTLAAVVEADARRVDAVMLAGAAAAKARKDGKAWEYCLKRGLRSDPYSRPVASLTHLYVRPADLLKPMVGSYAKLVADLDEDPSASVCEGLMAWFSEDFAGADKHFAKVISVDPKAADAYAYRALAALKRKDPGSAQKFSGRAVDSSRTGALGYFSQAMALMAVNKPDQAKVAATTALKFGPQLLGPRVVQGDVDGGRKDEKEARRVLMSVLLTDPQYRDAKRVLYKHGL